jgi:hypothetical protein
MQQYLINTTAIWLLSLLLFDVFLRREKFHGYNRFYLVATLLLGALLPLVQWGDNSYVYTGALHTQVERVVVAKQTIAAATVPVSTIDWQLWIGIGYFVGVIVAICLLLAEVVKLFRFSAKGKKSFHDGWKIIETGKDHAPFSFRSTLFVCSRQQYNADEWNMILVHEQRHTGLWHFADLLLIHIARIVFWFHPLVYVYNRRLLLVHEYQADNAAATEPQRYGQFLLEQAVLHAAPFIAHSFNRSPIKNRIVMLRRNSTSVARAKMLVLLPLMAVAFSCFSKNANSGPVVFARNGNTVTYKGNKFTLTEEIRDTMSLLNYVDETEKTQIRVVEPYPVAMNGRKIYNTVEVASEPEPIDQSRPFEDAVLESLVMEFNALADGFYHLAIANIVVDESGKVVYYEFGGITGQRNGVPVVLSDVQLSGFAKSLDEAISSAPPMKPALMDGRGVLVNSDISFSDYKVGVHGHITTIAHGNSYRTMNKK